MAAGLLGGIAGGLATTAARGPAPVAPAGAAVISTSSTALPGRVTAGSPQAAAAAIGPSVVTVEVSGSQAAAGGGLGGFAGQQSQPVTDTGSGIVLRTDGYVLTNNHVVAAAVSGGTVHITLSDGRTMPASIVGTDATSDLAVLHVTGAPGLRAAVFADSNSLTVGQAVLAVGAPLGLSNTVTQGIVSTVHRPVSTGEPGASAQSVIDAVQTDASINPGNSGGALVDMGGRVVGVNSAIATTGGSGTGTSGSIGVGFAIPSSDAIKVARQLIATGHATHAEIGISVRDAASSTDGAPGLGATVEQLTSGGPAARAGLQPGDIITKIGARLVTDSDSLIVAVRAYDPGATVPVTYTRQGRSAAADVTLGSAGS